MNDKVPQSANDPKQLIPKVWTHHQLKQQQWKLLMDRMYSEMKGKGRK